LLLPSGFTLVLSRSSSTAAFRIPTSASVTRAICSALALWILSVTLARQLSVSARLLPPAPLPSASPLESSAILPPWLLPLSTPPWASILDGDWVLPGSSFHLHCPGH
ncbi:hypothetical protein M9458_048142, partial [Cirrhinus mrigala]